MLKIAAESKILYFSEKTITPHKNSARSQESAFGLYPRPNKSDPRS
jgi:hypothetical protein